MKQVVRALLKNSEGKYLLVKHHSYDIWTTPGGHIEGNETLHRALKREIKEEFGVKINILGDGDNFGLEHVESKPLPIAIYKIEYNSYKYGRVKKMEHMFHAEIKSMLDFSVQEEEIAQYAWFESHEIYELENIYPQIPLLLKKITS